MTTNRHRSYSVTRSPLHAVPAHERKKLLERERRLRRLGEWGEWERIENTRRFGPGWLGDVDHVRVNRVFSVLVRDVETAIHLAVSSLSGDRPSWPEMQRIKNELAGPNASAVEVYPPQSQVVDDADMYHLWVVPGPLPFGLKMRIADDPA